MLIDVFALVEIVNDNNGDRLCVALTKEEYKKHVSNGEFSEEFIKRTFAEYNISNQMKA